MIRRIELRNWLCYRGDHSLDLESKAYAIVARHEQDTTASNGLGKSSLQEAIDFALFGRLARFRRSDADGWIARGAKDGAVRIAFEDGVTIERTRVRGKPTQVRFTRPTTGLAAQADAETEIAKWLCLSEEDFRAIYVEQRQTARLIHADPAERLTLFGGWFGLDKLEDAESLAAGIASEHAGKAEAEAAHANAIRSGLEETTLDDLQAKIAIAALVHEEADAKVESLENELRTASTREHAEKVLAEYRDVVERGKALAERATIPLKENIAKNASVAEGVIADLEAKVVETGRTLRTRRSVLRGEFDGHCPVASIQCPAKALINAGGVVAQQAEQRAADDARDALAAVNNARESYRHVLAEKARLERIDHELAVLRDHAQSLKERARVAKASLTIDARSVIEVENDLRDAKEKRHQAGVQTAELHAWRTNVTRMNAEARKADAGADAERKQTFVALAVTRIFRAAHRRIAECEMTAIGDAANDALSNAGVDLTIDVRWEREGKTPAKSCDQCGLAYPASARVKTCTRCGAPRGANLVSRLDLLPSKRSGAMDDLAGVATQLAAAEWLLARRKSPWGCMLLDEPLAACDRRNRAAMATALARLFRRPSGIRQAFVISHSPDTLDAFPGRITIIAGERGSRLEVV